MQELQEVEQYPLKPGEYRIPTSKGGIVVGQIRCSRSGLLLIDFYRTPSGVDVDRSSTNECVEKQG